ncbi:hypothetical protein ACFWP7_39920 [Streptomyces sp. NPDC058470]|uniref:hypothetical protein n=1 Tax=Streptomyces sp. NPDC058470 TaxID=3346515 RepID=UPI003665454E
MDGTLAMARLDGVRAYGRTGVRAYGLTTGEALWNRQPPDDGDQVVAHVSQDTADGVAVVLHHGDKAGHDETSDAWHVHLTGLDLRTGPAVWTRAVRRRAGSVSADTREVALGGGRIATARSRAGDTETTIRVLDAHTGDLQWERPLLEGWRDASVLAPGSRCAHRRPPVGAATSRRLGGRLRPGGRARRRVHRRPRGSRSPQAPCDERGR